MNTHKNKQKTCSWIGEVNIVKCPTTRSELQIQHNTNDTSQNLEKQY